MYQDDFCVRNCELLSRHFLQKSQTYNHITHSSDNSIISVKLYFVQYGFLLRQYVFYVMGQYTRGEGDKDKTQVKGRTEKRKT